MEKYFVHNVVLVFASLMIILVIVLSVGKRYADISKSNKAFFRLVYLLFVAGVLDILVNFFGVPGFAKLDFVYRFFRSFYSFSLCMMSCLFYQYTRSYKEGVSEKSKRSPLDFVIILLTFCSLSISVVNFFLPVITVQNEIGVKTRGSMYFICMGITYLILLLTSAYVVINKKSFTRLQNIAIFSFLAFNILGNIIEMLIHAEYLLVVFAATLSVIVLQLSLETPDYELMLQSMDEKDKQVKETEQARVLAENMMNEAEQAKIQLEASLNEAKELRNEALLANQSAEVAKNDAIKAVAAKTEFFSRMSHEIRTPMNAIIGMNELILNESKEENIISYATDAAKASSNLLNIVNNILDYSNLEKGNMQLLEDEYELKTLLKDIYNVYLAKANERNIKLIFDIDDDIPAYLVGDDVRIKQVLNNLLSNGIKYTDKGTVTLRLSLERKVKDSVLLKFIVKDTGRGIKEEDMIRLFDAFESADKKNDRTEDGAGFGISIVSKLLTMMGSKLMVESAFGLGSQFSFSIRQSFNRDEVIGDFYAENVHRNTSVKREIVKAPKANILVVDDNLMNIKVLEGLLRPTLVNIISAYSGKEAVELAFDNKYDLIFMDHLMPEMDGVEALSHIRKDANSINKETKIVALVANAIKGAYEEYKGFGFDDVVFKPSTQNEINNVLWELLPGHLIENDINL